MTEYIDRDGNIKSKEMFTQYVRNTANDPKDKEFGRRMKELIKKRGLKNVQAIDILGWTYSTFYSYYCGRKRIRINRLAQLVDKLSLTQSEMASLLEIYWEDEDG